MSEMKYYCFCSSNCRYETMTKEQILAAIAQAAETGMVYDPDAAMVSKVKESNAGGSVSFWVGTMAQYNAIENKDANCMYIITDDTYKADIEAAVSNAANNASAAQAEASSASSAASEARTTAAAAQTAANNAKTTASSAAQAAATAQATANSAASAANAALPKAGGAMTGYITTKGIKLTSGVDYGSSLPAGGTAGRLFFKKVSG
jgi:hypothetical protein